MYIVKRYIGSDDCFFFFSSRRRHTRYWRDWSSDVCSSDLSLDRGDEACADSLHGRRRGDEVTARVPDESGCTYGRRRCAESCTTSTPAACAPPARCPPWRGRPACELGRSRTSPTWSTGWWPAPTGGRCRCRRTRWPSGRWPRCPRGSTTRRCASTPIREGRPTSSPTRRGFTGVTDGGGAYAAH